MDMHYCDIFSDCYHCPVPFCPYEKLEDWGQDGYTVDDEQEDEEEDQEEGW
jgi:hypothetical protein